MAANESLPDLQRRFYDGNAPASGTTGAQAATARSGAEAASTATPTANVVALTDRVLVKAGSTRLVSYNIQNPNAAVIFVGLFNAATIGAVTLGVTVPLAWLAIPPAGVVDGVWPTSEPFNAGLVIAATTTPLGAVLAAVGLPVSLQVV